MAEDDPEDTDGEAEEPSFRERLEEAREAGRGTGDPFAGGDELGGNPFAQMMGGMMGGGLGGDMHAESRETAVAKELAQLREDVRDLTDEVRRVADALEER